MKVNKALEIIIAGLSLGIAAVQPAIAQEKTLFERLKLHVDASGRIKGEVVDRSINPDQGYERVHLDLGGGKILRLTYEIRDGRGSRYPTIYGLDNELWMDENPDGLNGNEVKIR